MDFAKLATKIQAKEPESTPEDVARIALLLLGADQDLKDLESDEKFEKAWADIKLRLKACMDQHGAMSEEIETLACSDPKQYTPDQVWVLVRAIKVQSQLLQFYTGNATQPIA